MKCLVDVNVLLDVLLRREPFALASSTFFEVAARANVELYLSAFSVTTIYYVTRTRLKSIAPIDRQTAALRAVDRAIRDFVIVPTNLRILRHAHEMSGSDFEDNAQVASAVAAGLHLIVTRDPAGFRGSPVEAVDPAEACRRLVPTSP